MSLLITLLASLYCALKLQARSLEFSTTASFDFPTTTDYGISSIIRLAFPHLTIEAKQFGEFAIKFRRNYATKDEVLTRFGIFVENLEKIHRYNEEAKGLTTFGITKFADWSWVEFRSSMLLKERPSLNITLLPQHSSRPQTKRPDSLDWRNSGIVTAIKDQGQCGSCWAFATAAVTESMNAKAGNGLLELAEQQMRFLDMMVKRITAIVLQVDCIEGGCDGGDLTKSFAYARDHGLPTEGDYPYQAQAGLCHEAQIAEDGKMDKIL